MVPPISHKSTEYTPFDFKLLILFTKKQKQVPRYVSVSFVYNNALEYVQMKTCSSNILIKPEFQLFIISLAL